MLHASIHRFPLAPAGTSVMSEIALFRAVVVRALSDATKPDGGGRDALQERSHAQEWLLSGSRGLTQIVFGIRRKRWLWLDGRRSIQPFRGRKLPKPRSTGAHTPVNRRAMVGRDLTTPAAHHSGDHRRMTVTGISIVALALFAMMGCAGDKTNPVNYALRRRLPRASRSAPAKRPQDT